VPDLNQRSWCEALGLLLGQVRQAVNVNRIQTRVGHSSEWWCKRVGAHYGSAWNHWTLAGANQNPSLLFFLLFFSLCITIHKEQVFFYQVRPRPIRIGLLFFSCSLYVSFSLSFCYQVVQCHHFSFSRFVFWNEVRVSQTEPTKSDCTSVSQS
jgi:hypothetical protein